MNYYHSMSNSKVRLPTSESIESNQSGNYQRNPMMGMNLNHQFSSNGNRESLYFDEE